MNESAEVLQMFDTHPVILFYNCRIKLFIVSTQSKRVLTSCQPLFEKNYLFCFFNCWNW